MTDQNDPHPIAERIATSVRDRLGGQDTSRRSFLSRSALAGGTLLAIGGSTGFALAQQEGDGPPSAPESATFDDVDATDVDVLNYALTLERLEDAFYTTGLETFSESDFMGAESLQSFSEEQRGQVFNAIQSAANHDAAHVQVLTQAIELLGGTPTPEDSYTFDFESVDDFLAVAQTLETTGVAAYAGAAPFVESPDLLRVLLSIHSVEARHSAMLNYVTGSPPAPNAFDPALSQDEVIDAIAQFLETGDGEPTTESPTETPTDGGEPTTESPTGSPTETPTGSPTESPTSSPTGSPTETPTGTPTSSPTGSPTGTSTGSPTSSPTTSSSTTSSSTTTSGNGL